jgi:hypothetical protein
MPDYQGAATQQGQANVNAAQQTTQLSNPNVQTPFGSQTVTYGPDGKPTVTQQLSPDQQNVYSGVMNNLTSSLSRPLSSYDFRAVTPLNTGALPANGQIDLNGLPAVNPLTSQGLFDINPIDTSTLAQRTVAPTVGGFNQVADALRAREAPRFERTREQNQNELLVRGFNPGTEGYNAQMDEVNRAENDFNLGLLDKAGNEQSRLFGMESDLRSQGLGEQMAQSQSGQSVRGQLFGERSNIANFEKSLRDQGLNEQQVKAAVDQENRRMALAEQLAEFTTTTTSRNRQVDEAIKSRAQPMQEYQSLISTMPQFQQFAGANVNAAPVFDAATNQGLFDLNRYGTQLQGELGTRQIDAGKKADTRSAIGDVVGSLFSFL